MTDHEHTLQVDAPADRLFAYLSDVSNLPDYFTAMTSATPAEGEAVHVVAVVNGEETEGEAFFRVDEERRHLEWGAQGPHDYHGDLDVTGDDSSSEVRLHLHTQRGEAEQIDEGIKETLAAIKAQVEQGSAPGPTG